ncbi:MAG: helix-turn-helix domain-containing protein [Deltaproteobacteria bacterium]|nr:helix-turn-helix domain-containing protein [Deltaproteobacteria bacterium]
MPSSQIVLKAKKPLPTAYPKILKTLGDHLRKSRLDLKLLQKDVAQKLGACEQSICNWEKNLSKPAIKYIPKIVEFLGYVPFDTYPKSIGEKIVLYRKLYGLSQKLLARQLGIDPSTLREWEMNRKQPPERIFKIIS